MPRVKSRALAVAAFGAVGVAFSPFVACRTVFDSVSAGGEYPVELPGYSVWRITAPYNEQSNSVVVSRVPPNTTLRMIVAKLDGPPESARDARETVERVERDCTNREMACRFGNRIDDTDLRSTEALCSEDGSVEAGGAGRRVCVWNSKNGTAFLVFLLKPDRSSTTEGGDAGDVPREGMAVTLDLQVTSVNWEHGAQEVKLDLVAEGPLD